MPLLLACVLPALAAAAPGPGCGAPRVLVERFLSAGCAACWSAAAPMPAGVSADEATVLDWIVPAPDGDAAPLAVAAVAEARARATRAGRLLPDEALTVATRLPPRAAWSVQAEDGIAWNGYLGLRLAATWQGDGPMPAGLVGWLGLAERIPAGDDGTTTPRRLVRTLIGPLPLVAEATAASGDPGARPGPPPVEHLRAVRLPENAKPERLTAVGWIENDRGRVIAVAPDAAAGCR